MYIEKGNSKRDRTIREVDYRKNTLYWHFRRSHPYNVEVSQLMCSMLHCEFRCC